MHGDEYIDW